MSNGFGASARIKQLEAALLAARPFVQARRERLAELNETFLDENLRKKLEEVDGTLAVVDTALEAKGVSYRNYAVSNFAKIYRREGFTQVKIEHPQFKSVAAAHDWARQNLDLGERLS